MEILDRKPKRWLSLLQPCTGCAIKDEKHSKVVVEHNPDAARLEKLDIASWPAWSKAVSVFPFEFDDQETACLLEGECVITPDDGGEPVHFGAGDLVVFPAGLSCTWEVRKTLKKHYSYD